MMTRGRGGVSIPPKSDDVIYEQPLTPPRGEGPASWDKIPTIFENATWAVPLWSNFVNPQDNFAFDNVL